MSLTVSSLQETHDVWGEHVMELAMQTTVCPHHPGYNMAIRWDGRRIAGYVPVLGYWSLRKYCFVSKYFETIKQRINYTETCIFMRKTRSSHKTFIFMFVMQCTSFLREDGWIIVNQSLIDIDDFRPASDWYQRLGDVSRYQTKLYQTDILFVQSKLYKK